MTGMRKRAEKFDWSSKTLVFDEEAKEELASITTG
jgi:hypothetical protein